MNSSQELNEIKQLLNSLIDLQRAQLLTNMAALTQDPVERAQMIEQAKSIFEKTAYLGGVNDRNNVFFNDSVETLPPVLK